MESRDFLSKKNKIHAPSLIIKPVRVFISRWKIARLHKSLNLRTSKNKTNVSRPDFYKKKESGWALFCCFFRLFYSCLLNSLVTNYYPFPGITWSSSVFFPESVVLDKITSTKHAQSVFILVHTIIIIRAPRHTWILSVNNFRKSHN